MPVKRLDQAKTRLASTAQARARLALAFAEDTADAVLSCPAVAELVVVTSDAVVARAVAGLGAHVVSDPHDVSLDSAVALGAAWVRHEHAGADGVAVLLSDLPALRADDLSAALAEAARHERAVVADADGSGTTTLTALAGVQLHPSFGAGSHARHVRGGAVDVGRSLTSLRRDVDTAADLADACTLGLRRRSAAVVVSQQGRRQAPDA